MLIGFTETAENINLVSAATDEAGAKEAMKRFQEDLEIHWVE